MKKKVLKVLALVVAIALIIGIGLFANALVGNPVSKYLATKNANEYIKELKNLDSYIITALAGSKNRKFIAFHPAFGYFAEDYSLTMYALEEHGKETTAKRLAEMADLAKRENIKSIFYQAEASKKQALAFAEEIDGRAVMLEPLSPDYVANLKAMTDSLKEAIK